MKQTNAEPLNFTGWFERESTLVEAACQTRGISCSRKERTAINIGAASIDLVQLQRALDHQPPDSHERTVLAWIDKAIDVLDANPVRSQLADVFPHLRSPKDQAAVPWIRKLANNRLLCCLVSEDADSMRYLGPIELTKMGSNQEQIIDRAKQNLGQLPPHSLADCTPHAHCPNVWTIDTKDGHDAARLLIADTIVGGAAVVWIPHRDRLVLSTSTPQMLGPWVDQLRDEAIQSARHAKHPITAEAFLVKDGVVSHLRYQRSDAVGQLLLPEDEIMPRGALP